MIGDWKWLEGNNNIKHVNAHVDTALTAAMLESDEREVDICNDHMYVICVVDSA